MVGTYVAAWNAEDAENRRRMLERSLTDDVELVEPRGSWKGIAAVDERITAFRDALPGTEIVIDSGLDVHNDVVRYGWKIVDQRSQAVMRGIDVAERGDGGRLKRVLMFHGPLPPASPQAVQTETPAIESTVMLGEVTIKYVHAEGPYALLEWSAPAGAQTPPVHIHHHTDEGFYVLDGTYAFMLDGNTTTASAGSHVLVRKGHPHTFWNAGDGTASCLILLSPPGFEEYFRELAVGLAAVQSDDQALDLRRVLSARHDIEVVGPPAAIL